MKIVQIRARFGNMCLMEIPRLTWSENMGFTCLPDSPLIFSKEINEQADGCFTAGVGPHKESESLIDIMDIKTVLRKVKGLTLFYIFFVIPRFFFFVINSQHVLVQGCCTRIYYFKDDEGRNFKNYNFCTYIPLSHFA